MGTAIILVTAIISSFIVLNIFLQDDSPSFPKLTALGICSIIDLE